MNDRMKLLLMHIDGCFIWDRVSVGISGSGTRTRTTAWLTALTPDSCWPMFMMMMETSCQRRERWDSRLSTDRRPSALSDCSSRRISSSSSSTSSQPRRRWSAEGDGAHRPPSFPASVAGFFEAVLVFSHLPSLSFRLLSGWACTWGSPGRRAAAGALSRQEPQSDPAWGASLDAEQTDFIQIISWYYVRCRLTIGYFTCAVAQDVSDAQHLCTEDANGDEELWHDAEGSPQVFWRKFSQIHGHHVGWKTCRRGNKTLTIS